MKANPDPEVSGDGPEPPFPAERYQPRGAAQGEHSGEGRPPCALGPRRYKRHASMGRHIPAQTLGELGMKQCLACKCILANVATCACEMGRKEFINLSEGAAMEEDAEASGERSEGVPVCPAERRGTPLFQEMPNDLCPPLAQVLSIGLSTVRHIPGALERRVAACLGASLMKVVKEGSWESLAD